MKQIKITSFGFRYSLPEDNYIVDVRWVKDPAFFVKGSEDGTSEKVKNFLRTEGEAKKAVDTIVKLALEREPTSLAIGCAVGKHRSVYIAEEVKNILQEKFQVTVEHRDLDKS